ncbi:MAG: dihydroorotase [Flavobacteriaceae bacterium]|nr:dihydroorotase [Flavobacteriaceae bacterium]
MKLLICAATIIDSTSPFHQQQADVFIDNGYIVKIGSNLQPPDDAIQIKLDNLHLSLGWFDSSVSFGEPGFEERETLENGLRTAAKSGFTRILLNSNTQPIPNQASAIQYPITTTANNLVDIHPLGALTMDAKGEALAELYDMQQAGAVAFYDYQHGLENANLLKIALQYAQGFDGLICAFPLQPSLAHKGVANEELVATQLGLKGIPSLAESIQIQRDLSLLEYTGGKLHIPTISTKESVTLIAEAKQKQLDVSCSVALSNLWFTDTALEKFDTNFKVLPPLRTERDRKALIEGVKNGTIDFVCSDHRPLDIEDKKMEFDLAAFGTTALQSMFGILTQVFDLETTIDILTRNTERFGLAKPKIEIGQAANLSLFNPNEETVLTADQLLASSKNSAFVGQNLKGKVYGVIHNKQYILNQ